MSSRSDQTEMLALNFPLTPPPKNGYPEEFSDAVCADPILCRPIFELIVLVFEKFVK